MYCVSLMDRTNLGIAAVAGMSVDLKLSIGARYSIITCLFFVVSYEMPIIAQDFD